MRIRQMTACFLVIVFALSCTFGQTPAGQNPPPKDESNKFRIICTLAGAGGGFTLGVFAGIAAYDDAINSDRKVWTVALISAAAGGVGGYFLGRAIDRRNGSVPQVRPDRFDQGLQRAEQRMYGFGLPAPAGNVEMTSAVAGE